MGTDFDREFDAIEWTLEDRELLALTIDRPDRLNAIDADVREAIAAVLDGVDREAVRCVTVEGAGEKAFSAGTDVDDVAGRSAGEAIAVTPIYETVREYPRPTLAKVDGYCLGGGLELALACDLRVATRDAEFGFPEVNLGLIPGGGGTQHLVRLLGEARAKELVFRGDRIDAEQAAEWGLVNRAVAPDEFDTVVESYLKDLLAGPPLAHAVAKRVINNAEDVSLDAGMAMESQGMGYLTTTDDFEEGQAAFRQDRDPEFEGQ